MGRPTLLSSAAALSSLSFLTVSLPMWFSLEMGSSSDGISCFFRFFVRLVTTCSRRARSLDAGNPYLKAMQPLALCTH